MVKRIDPPNYLVLFSSMLNWIKYIFVIGQASLYKFLAEKERIYKMKYMGDSNWWNARFKNRELNVMVHEKCLEDDIRYFSKKGQILDIASGDGRNAIYLARLGYKVLAIDFCEEALKRLNYFSKKRITQN